MRSFLTTTCVAAVLLTALAILRLFPPIRSIRTFVPLARPNAPSRYNSSRSSTCRQIR